MAEDIQKHYSSGCYGQHSTRKGNNSFSLVDIGFGKDHAEKLLPQYVNIGLLMLLENRLGKQHQYVLSNYMQLLKPKDPELKKDEFFLMMSLAFSS